MVVHKVWLLMAMVCAASSASAQTTLTILHTNDLHGHVEGWTGWEGSLQGRPMGGFDRIASVIKSVRSEAGARNVIVLDAGDTFADSLLGSLTKGQLMIKLMNAAGYDAMALGNHEFDFGVSVLRSRMREARFPFLAANVLDARTRQPFAKPYVMREASGTTVGILGLAYPNTPLTTARKNVAGLVFEEAVATVRTYVPRMRAAGARIIILLSHYGLSADQQLAQEVPGIDVIVGGHSHNRMTEAVKVGSTLIVQAGAHGSDVGRLDLFLKGNSIAGHKRVLVPLDHAFVPSDHQAELLIRASLQQYRRALTPVAGTAAGPLIRAQTLAGQEPRKRDAASPADQLFADILRKETNSDIALLPGVGYGVGIGSGPVTAAMLRNLIPHDAKVVTFDLTGSQVEAILEQSVENTVSSDPRVKVGGLIQVSGITFHFDPDGATAHRVAQIQVAGRDLERDKTYRAATNALLAEGGHRYQAFLDGKNRREHASQYEMVKASLMQQGTFSPPAQERSQNTR